MYCWLNFPPGGWWGRVLLMAKRALEMTPPHPKKAKEALEAVEQQVTVPGPDYREQFRQDREPHEPSVSELEELDHIVVNAAYQIEQMVLKFQWLRGVDLPALCAAESPPVRQLMSRHRLRLACALVQQYWDRGIPVFDDLMSTRHALNLTALPQARAGDLSAARLDELQALILQSAINSIKVMRQRVKGDDEFLEQTSRVIHDLKKEVKKNAKRAEKAEAGKSKDGSGSPHGSPGPAWPPPLPEIDDDALLQQVFTHRSAIVDASMSSKADILSTHNERLEFKGDSVLDFIICDVLFAAFPTAAEGSLSIMKSSLVCNDTLFDISVAYRLHERLRVSTDLHSKVFGPHVPFGTTALPDATKKNKAVADVFEAYIAGVAINRGLKVVQTWLQALYAPLVDDLRSTAQVGVRSDVDRNAKNELYMKIGSVDQAIAYETLNDTSPYTVACVVAGKELARAEDRSVKLAGLRAAEAVLQQPALVEEYAARRRSTPKTAPTTGH